MGRLRCLCKLRRSPEQPELDKTTEWVAAHCDAPSSAYTLFKIVRHSNASGDKNTATVYVHGIDVSYASNQ